MPSTAEKIDLAELVADEVLQAFNSHDGPKWETIDGEEKAVSFVVDVPSIAGKTVKELNPTGLGSTGDFHSYLLAAGGGYVNGRLVGQTLHGVHCWLEVRDGAYTGQATVSDRSGAFEYDF